MQADLSRYHGLRIRDWWRGEVSSQELYACIVHLPDDSATKTAARDGDWHEDRYLLVRLINELLCYRADFVSAHGGDMKPDLVLSPKQTERKRLERQQYLDVREMMLAQMRGEYQPPSRAVHFETEYRKGVGVPPPAETTGRG
ncbi:hypothetical protein IU500_06915 [Nocardia terpenica]|uniref:hypothetical protein n=1 Tax=Nocardia terpenica TaxID=455432 RepID=UPI001894B9EE|nr:hypothetical protein [Nocardia terpenica]MBF6060507.1 hypothetical protein [Nocardia terpenica]MBF6103767.1 hypothetical protein [Nocardia terpenica]MBF6111859.1 hypothetical protein [Nocardia terpenica]MBF6117988.1 hypothetical protein [Nocardia terpenica]MBF6155286.1 hypothetical protein [Nocardia terpenica]